MADKTTEWIHATPARPRKRRAAVVCILCHAKKIKCDLQSRKQANQACTNCERSGESGECRERMPMRERKSRISDSVSSQRQSQPLALTAQSSRNTEDPIPANASHSIMEGGAAEEIVFPCGSPPNVEQSHRGDLDTGFLQVYRRETDADALIQTLEDDARRAAEAARSLYPISSDLLYTFVETYFENCYTWCPVLDRESILGEMAQSSMLGNALALAASHLKPPILPHDGPASYYDRARRAFYEDDEPDALRTLKSLLLFYWWAPRSTALVHRHSSWWWTSAVIRQAQMMNIHRESLADTRHPQIGMRRRIWWTAFARERLTALCQSKPVLINLADCKIPQPTLQDFGGSIQDQMKAEVFIQYIKLCDIIGNLAQHLTRDTHGKSPFPRGLAEQLIDWVHTLPQHLSLRIEGTYTLSYSQDIHQLHLPYLVSIVVLHLKHASNANALPQALPPAVVAASCIARIFKDILARGSTRFLLPITSWYCGISFVALASARRDPSLAESVATDMDVIRLTCNELRLMWGSASVLFHGFGRLADAAITNGLDRSPRSFESSEDGAEYLPPHVTFEWKQYFPFAACETSATINKLLMSQEDDQVFRSDEFSADIPFLNLQSWFDLDNPDFWTSPICG